MNEIIGGAAALLTTLSFIPQVVKVYRSRSASDLSWAWVVMMSTGVFLWLVYGLAINRLPLIAANAVTLACLITIGAIKGRRVEGELRRVRHAVDCFGEARRIHDGGD